MNPKKHAIVIGASIGGLLTARVLSDHFEQVSMIERDPVHDEPESRKGQAQTRHLHVLLASGYEIVSRLFPGIQQELLAGGAIEGDQGAGMRWHHFGVWKKQFTSGIKNCLMSRPYLEWHVRRRVLALPNVRLLAACEVKKLLTTADHSQVIGAHIVHRQENQREETITADLVVDCAGRGSSATKWLEEWGYARPEESRVKINFAYGTRVYRRLPTDLPGANLMMIAPTPPSKTGAYMFPIEGDCWILTAGGIHGVEPPTNEADFLEYLRNLPVPDIYNIISRAEPLSDIVPYKFPFSLRRHYEKLQKFPGGYLVIGDAVASFNPIYGQGMSSAAMQVAELEKLLNRKGYHPNLWRSYFKQAAKVVDIPWQLAVGEDFRWQETEGTKAPGVDLINRYMGRLYRMMGDDTIVYEQFLKVMNFLAPPTSLMHPRLLWRVLMWQEKKNTAVSAPHTSSPLATVEN